MSHYFRKSLYRASPPCLLQVKRAVQISPGLLRITMTGDGLDSFPAFCPAAHVKLFLPRPGQNRPALPTLGPDGPIWPVAEPKPIVRTYSVRNFRHAAREIDVEFAIHGVEGPATRFARRAAPGDYIGMSYPGGPDPMIPPASCYYFAGDMSALPALASILEHLHQDARGAALIRCDDEQDVQNLQRPAAMHLDWVVGGIRSTGKVIEAFKTLPSPPKDTFFWVGGEHTLAVSLRQYLNQDSGVPKDALYALPYWRHSYDEENYHKIRDAIMEGGHAE